MVDWNILGPLTPPGNIQKRLQALTPLSRAERAHLRPKLGDPEWFNARRSTRPGPEHHKPAGGILLHKDLLSWTLAVLGSVRRHRT
jgi:hypothetical protein